MIDSSYRYSNFSQEIKTKYFVISGLDGAGKTTQIKLLKKELEKLGKSVIILHHKIDDNMFFNNALRFIYTNINKEKISQTDIGYIIAFEYLGYFIESIIPKLNKNIIILMDRGFYDLLVSQTTVFNNNFDKGWLLLEKICRSGVHFFLDVSPERCFHQIKLRNTDIKPHENLEILIKKYIAYKNLVDKKFLIPVNGERSIEKINEELMQKIILFLEK